MAQRRPQHCLLADHSRCWLRWLALSLLLSLSGLSLSSCQSHGSIPQYNSSVKQISAVPFEHIEQYASSTEDASIDPGVAQQLRSIADLIAQHELTAAHQQLQQLEASTLHGLHRPYKLLYAQWYMARNEPWKAISILKSLGAPRTDHRPIQANYQRLLGQAYAANHQNLSALQAHITLDTWLDQDEKASNDLATWQAAQNMTSRQRQAALKRHPTATLQGWLTLANIEASAEHKQPQWAQALRAWQATHPDHPGQAMLTHNTHMASPQTPQHIAILLPQTGTGQLSAAAQAITHGIFTAYYDANKRTDSTKLTLIDTAQGDITAHYQAALTQGADFIIGPLTKDHIQVLTTQQSFRVPTLVLNNIRAGRIQADAPVIQFGLSPIDEAQQIANRAWLKGARQALLLYPDDAWGRQVGAAFRQHWQRLGGQLSDQKGFKPTDQLNTMLKSLLGIDASEARIAAVKQALNNNPIKTVPRHRDDIDCIILLATTEQTQKVYPFLKFNYSGALPTYALAQTDPGYATSPNFYHDLEQINFPSTPWMSAPNKLPPSLRQWHHTLQQNWPTSFKQYKRLYALGIDAYQLSQQWAALTTFSGFELEGASGRLSLTADQHVHRNLRWARIKANRAYMLDR